MRIRCFAWLLIFVVLAIFGCEGPRGPAGPAGSANVIYSDWHSPADWVLGTTFGVQERSYTMTAPGLTQDIIDNGVVLVYMRFIGFNPAISQLPVILEDVHYSFLFRPQVGSIKVAYYRTTSPTADPGTIPSENLVRYVLIPGGVLDEAAVSGGVSSAILSGSLDHMSYDEVCDLFDIPE